MPNPELQGHLLNPISPQPYKDIYSGFLHFPVRIGDADLRALGLSGAMGAMEAGTGATSRSDWVVMP